MTTSLIAQLEAAAAQTNWTPARPSDTKQKRPDSALKFENTLANIKGVLQTGGLMSHADLQERTGLVRPTVTKGLRHFMERGELAVAIAAERKARAKLCEEKGGEWCKRSLRMQHHSGAGIGALVCADEIRARGVKT